jgi:hypothetical protein
VPSLRRPTLRLALLLLLLAPARESGADGPAVLPPAVPPPAAPPPAPPQRLGVASLLPPDTPREELATFAWLEHLGWRFAADPAVPRVAITPGHVGHRASIAEAHAQGDLAVRVPPTPAGAAELRALLPQFIDGSATRLAYQHQVELATRVAAGKLEALTKMGRFKFPQLIFWNSPWFQFHPPPEAWQVVAKNYTPRGKPSEAIEAFYARGGLSECYSAQWLLVYAAQYELLGREAFDEMLPSASMVIGRPEDIRPTPLGEYQRADRTYPYRALFIKPADISKDPGVLLAQLGPRAFACVTGIVRAHDQSDECNQNLVSISISARACEDLRTKGGMGYVSDLGKRLFAAMKGDGPQAAAEKARLLAEPLLAEWKIYVHPFGIVTLGWMLEYEMDDENRSAYVLVYLQGREDFFYQRHRETFVARHLRGLGIGPDRRTQPETLTDPRRR